MAVISGFNTANISYETPLAIGQSFNQNATLEEDALEVRSLTTKERVEQYFSDLPIMIDVARCESYFRQTYQNGEVFRGERNRYDVGVMQINELYHLKESKKLGYDIYSLDGNLGYARYLYEKEGVRPWLQSSACWAKYTSIVRR